MKSLRAQKKCTKMKLKWIPDTVSSNLRCLANLAVIAANLVHNTKNLFYVKFYYLPLYPKLMLPNNIYKGIHLQINSHGKKNLAKQCQLK